LCFEERVPALALYLYPSTTWRSRKLLMKMGRVNG